MTVVKALFTVVGTAVLFGVSGGIIGGMLGRLTPAFYRQLFHVSDDAVEFGVGIGITNGVIWGLVVGIAVVGIIAWKDSRVMRRDGGGKNA